MKKHVLLYLFVLLLFFPQAYSSQLRLNVQGQTTLYQIDTVSSFTSESCSINVNVVGADSKAFVSPLLATQDYPDCDWVLRIDDFFYGPVTGTMTFSGLFFFLQSELDLFGCGTSISTGLQLITSAGTEINLNVFTSHDVYYESGYPVIHLKTFSNLMCFGGVESVPELFPVDDQVLYENGFEEP